MIYTAILGATGYTGVELIRLLQNHPQFEIKSLYARSLAGEKLSTVYPGFLNEIDLVCRDLENIDYRRLCQEHSAIFCALPHGVSMNIVGQIMKNAGSNNRIVDLSADFRYDSTAVYNDWYEKPHTETELNQKGVYGLPELFRGQLQNTRLVANPGCYPTVSILSLAPLLRENLIKETGIIVDAKSGVSGAGRTPSSTTHFSEVHNNFQAYKVAAHRHGSEIREKLSRIGGAKVELAFTPHLVPMQRGILITAYAEPRAGVLYGDAEEKTEQLLNCYREYYDDEPFIKIYGDSTLPATRDVHATNYCAITARYDPACNRVIVIGAIDNLCKGASGQAVQNMNLLFGFDEQLGLKGSFVL